MRIFGMGCREHSHHEEREGGFTINEYMEESGTEKA